MTRGFDVRIRILSLGNDLLADDAFGCVVAEELRRIVPAEVEVTCVSTAGFNLLEEILDATHLLVIDTVLTGGSPPGTVYQLREGEVQVIHGNSPHYVGLFEALELGRRLHLPVPGQVTILAVEAADCTTVGGPMHPDVQAAIPVVAHLAQEVILGWRNRPCMNLA